MNRRLVLRVTVIVVGLGGCDAPAARDDAPARVEATAEAPAEITSVAPDSLVEDTAEQPGTRTRTRTRTGAPEPAPAPVDTVDVAEEVWEWPSC